MSAALKYTLGRLGLFVAVFALLLPVPLNILVKAMIALVASAGFSYFLLRKWRDEMAEQLGSAQQRRQAEKNRLRAALAGDEAAAAAGDRAADSAAAQTPAAQPPAAQTPAAQPPAAQMPVAQMPVEQPPATETPAAPVAATAAPAADTSAAAGDARPGDASAPADRMPSADATHPADGR
jgi:Protein of unknown function (DUF4229)